MIAEALIGRVLARSLRRYQLDWIRVGAPFIAHLGGRQIGKDFAWSLRVALDLCFKPGSLWNIISATARHAHTFLSDVRSHCEMIRRVIRAAGGIPPEFKGNRVTALELDNRSLVESHAATVRSIQGRRGSVLFNEVGAIPRAMELFEAAFPIVTGQLDQGRRAQIVLIGNASTQGTFWHRFFTGPASAAFVRLRSTWGDCFRSWLAELGWSAAQIQRWIVKRQRQRQKSIGFGAWAQWYNCEWRSPEDSYFGAELLDAQSIDPWTDGPSIREPAVQQLVGMDIGRHKHPTVIAPLLLGDHAAHGAGLFVFGEPMLRILHKTPYHVQRAILAEVVAARTTIGIVPDSTGSGDDTAEQIARAWPGLAKPYSFNETSKFGLVASGRELLAQRKLWLDAGDLDSRMELDGITVQDKGLGRSAVHVPEGSSSHSDRAIAILLGASAYRAATRINPAAEQEAPMGGPRLGGVADFGRLTERPTTGGPAPPRRW